MPRGLVSTPTAWQATWPPKSSAKSHSSPATSLNTYPPHFSRTQPSTLKPEPFCMHIIRHIADLPSEARGGAVSIGNFDGVHLGHAAIVRRLLERAAGVDGPAIVFTFDPHPVRLLRPEQCPPPLTWTERKAELLANLGVDWIVAYPTDQALLRLSAQEFF